MGKLRHLETHTLRVQEKVRTGAIQVRKVRGDVNPEDIFTKHLPSKDKVHQLVKLFGCECRAGRSTAAPLLRPKGTGRGQGGPPSTGYLPTFSTDCDPFADIEAHNPELLPHHHDEQEMKSLFPILEALPAAVNVEDWLRSDEDMGELAGGRQDGLERPVTDRRVKRPPGSSR